MSDYDEKVAEVLSRFSVQDLVEQKDESLARADELFYKAEKAPQVVEQGEENLIKWWKVQGGSNVYECRRFKNFVFCSCRDFFFRRQMCKHLAVTTRVYCANCFVLSATVGRYCYGCDMTINHFLRPSAKAA